MSPKNQGDKPTLGYPQIEALLESEDFSGVNKSFSEAYKNLETIFHDGSNGMKKQKDARKAMTAYEYTTAMIRELLEVKYQLLEHADKKDK